MDQDVILSKQVLNEFLSQFEPLDNFTKVTLAIIISLLHKRDCSDIMEKAYE